MKQIFKRLFCLVLCAVLAAGMLPATAATAQETKAAAYTWAGVYDDKPVYFYAPIPAEPLTAQKSAKNTIGTDEWGFPTFTTFAELKSFCKEDSEEYIHLTYAGTGDLVISENLTIPENMSLGVQGDDVCLIVEKGITLKVDGYINIETAATIKGTVVNNEQIDFSGSKLTFASTAAYKGNGYLLINKPEVDTALEDKVSGLPANENFLIHEYDYTWEIRDITGLYKISDPQNLQWNKGLKWENGKATVVTRPGSVLFEVGDMSKLDGDVVYQVTLYKEGEIFYFLYYEFDEDYLRANKYVECNVAAEVDMTSGSYHFVVTGMTMEEDTDLVNSEAVASKTWTYTKPSSRYARPTNQHWDWPMAQWDKTATGQYKIEFFWSSSEEMDQYPLLWTYSDTPTCEMDTQILEMVGPGYYAFRVRTISDDFTRKYHSAWTELSEVYNYTGEEKPGKPTIAWGSDDKETGRPTLTWKRVNGANKYRIYRSTSKTGTFKLVDTVSSDEMKARYSFVDEDAKANDRYYYKVRAVSPAGISSSYSNTVSAFMPLVAPEVEITGRASSGKPIVEWDTVEGAAKYYIYRSTKKTSGYTRVATAISARSYTDTSAKAGTKYYYKVKAIHKDSDANSAYSLVVSRVCDLKRPAVTITLTSGGNPYLKWSEISGAAKYYVYRSTAKSGTYKFLDSTTAEKYVDKDVTAGKTYYYKVKAVHSNTAANSAYSAIKYVKAK